jgi:hypothetical protein
MGRSIALCSNSARSCSNAVRRCSVRYTDPSRLHATRSALGATAAVGSICSSVSRSTMATRSVERSASNSCARIATRRACARSRWWTVTPRAWCRATTRPTSPNRRSPGDHMVNQPREPRLSQWSRARELCASAHDFGDVARLMERNFATRVITRLEPVLAPRGFPCQRSSAGPESVLFHRDGPLVDEVAARYPAWFAAVQRSHGTESAFCLDLWVQQDQRQRRVSFEMSPIASSQMQPETRLWSGCTRSRR